jgi:hypothetical protein
MRAWIRNGEAYAFASVAVGCIVVVVSSVFLWQWKHKKKLKICTSTLWSKLHAVHQLPPLITTLFHTGHHLKL